MKYELCRKIYDIVEDNLLKAGEKMAFGKFSFCSQMKKKNRDSFDLFDISNLHLDRKEFVEICYLVLLNRLPEEQAFINWSNLEFESNEEFQKVCFNSISNSAERKLKGTIVKNNYFEE